MKLSWEIGGSPNVAVGENPALILEDPFGDGWLFKVQADEARDLKELVGGRDTDDDDDDDEDDKKKSSEDDDEEED